MFYRSPSHSCPAQISPALTVLTKLIYSLDDEILIDACWAIPYLSDGSNDKIQAVIESGVCRRLVDLLMHPSTSVQTPALRSVGNIVTGDDLQTQVVIASGALPALLSLLSSPKDGIRKEACWTISNVTAGSPPQIQSVIDANIIPPLINILQNADFKTRKEACWAISNATSGGLQEPAIIRYLVSQGCIKPLCDLLTMMDNKIIQVALDGLDNILKIGEADKTLLAPVPPTSMPSMLKRPVVWSPSTTSSNTTIWRSTRRRSTSWTSTSLMRMMSMPTLVLLRSMLLVHLLYVFYLPSPFESQ